MTKAALVEEVSRVADLTKKHSEVIVDTVFRSIITALRRGEKIELRSRKPASSTLCSVAPAISELPAKPCSPPIALGPSEFRATQLSRRPAGL